MTAAIADGDNVGVAVAARGKCGTISDRKLGKTGHARITVTLADGTRFKTLARFTRRT